MPQIHAWQGMMRSVNEHERRAVARIMNVRRHREMTQQQLADASGLTRVALQLIETGKRSLKLGEAVNLCAVLRIDLAELVAVEPLVVHSDVQFD